MSETLPSARTDSPPLESHATHTHTSSQSSVCNGCDEDEDERWRKINDDALDPICAAMREGVMDYGWFDGCWEIVAELFAVMLHDLYEATDNLSITLDESEANFEEIGRKSMKEMLQLLEFCKQRLEQGAKLKRTVSNNPIMSHDRESVESHSTPPINRNPDVSQSNSFSRAKNHPPSIILTSVFDKAILSLDRNYFDAWWDWLCASAFGERVPAKLKHGNIVKLKRHGRHSVTISFIQRPKKQAIQQMISETQRDIPFHISLFDSKLDSKRQRDASPVSKLSQQSPNVSRKFHAWGGTSPRTPARQMSFNTPLGCTPHMEAPSPFRSQEENGLQADLFQLEILKRMSNILDRVTPDRTR